MTSHTNLIVAIIGVLLLIGGVSAAPTIGGYADITSNNVNVTVNGVGGDNVAWIMYGQSPNGEVWISSNYTASAGTATVQVWGAPLLGNTVYYVEACDSTGCSAESTFSTAVITPLPITNYGAGYKNITKSHFNVMMLVPAILQGYFNVMPASVFFGLLFGLIVIGMWRRNRGVRLVSVVMIILSPMIMSSNAGLMFGIPLVEQALGQALLAAGLAGVLLSLIKK
jgi:hypothetical protein